MKHLASAMIATLLAGCSGMGMQSTDTSQAARNRCEAMRSYQPYRANECAEPALRMQTRDGSR